RGATDGQESLSLLSPSRERGLVHRPRRFISSCTLCARSLCLSARERYLQGCSQNEIGRALEELDNDEVLPFDDPRWNTEISMEIPRYRPASDAGPIGDDDVPEGIDEAANGDGSSA
ncbi:hypothetical protein CVT25_004639, partial [Psilocybe cyanescens]